MKRSKKVLPLSREPEKQKPDSPQRGNKIRLADFIQGNIKPIVKEWEAFAQTLTPASNEMTPLALRDHIHEILAFVVSDIKSSQSNAQQVQKSRGNKKKNNGPTAAETHAALRLAGGFNVGSRSTAPCVRASLSYGAG